MTRTQTKTRAPDKRVQSTFDRLVAALRELMTQAPYERISVAEICSRANVSRSSYYAHFTGKQALFDKSLEYLACELVADEDPNRSIDLVGKFSFLPGFLQHAREHQAIYLENRFGATRQVIHRNIVMLLSGLARNELSSSARGARTSELTLTFLIGGAYAVIESWLEQGCREPVEQKLEQLDALISDSLVLG